MQSEEAKTFRNYNKRKFIDIENREVEKSVVAAYMRKDKLAMDHKI